MPQAQIITDPYDGGIHNREGNARLYRDASTICIVPTRGVIPARVVQTWWNMMTPMNQKFYRTFMIGMEVGAAYTAAIEQILSHPDLSQWKYLLTLEEDNIPPPDGLLKLIRVLEDHDELGAVGGLYWTKGEAGQPMIYGDPAEIPLNFRPIPPRFGVDGVGQIVECNGLGMGFTLFRLDMFKNPRIERPWFKTVQQWDPGTGAAAYTQDLFFFEKARREGYRFAVDCDCKVGHYDYQNDQIW